MDVSDRAFRLRTDLSCTVYNRDTDTYRYPPDERKWTPERSDLLTNELCASSRKYSERKTARSDAEMQNSCCLGLRWRVNVRLLEYWSPKRHMYGVSRSGRLSHDQWLLHLTGSERETVCSNREIQHTLFSCLDEVLSPPSKIRVQCHSGTERAE